ncbi:tRNA lysidine(34) synthetase TilS [Bacteroides mediterraneensis]|uniref:tRNA(Ile)-lysidine synthase n=1 Tax=Bacteroides mediterraneensis TaxID=1841856 RepID=A0ABS2EYS1_9BACE|nr:tRNA lysidine(34) synthetase TilS [Bacteroides mediterraneensis]MBM6759699.1 tRNA lysidine(34) synthetase TilS [Bacteroides mediterraneensis]
MFARKVSQFIEEKHLFGRGDKVLVALSGGADSVALLRVLLRLGYVCEAAHCNFHLRGEESVRDERFVRDLTERLGVPLHVTHFDTQAYAASKGISIEMAARELRYGWFSERLQACGAKVVAVAHHRDDSVETFLLNLVRGTGIDGLQGIRPVNGEVVRPLLCVSRAEILDYLTSLGQDYVTDSTNLQDEFMRNKLRLHVIPLLETLNPSVSETIAETARRLSDVAVVYHKAMEEAKQRVIPDGETIDIPALCREPGAKNLLFELLHPLGFNAAQVDDVFRALQGESGRMFYSRDWTLLIDRGRLIRRRAGEGTECLPELLLKRMEVEPPFTVPHDNKVAYVDAEVVEGELVLRKWQSGDKFIPFGMKGFKSVRNYLRDKKFSRFDKENQWVVCDGDRVVWLVEERVDNRFRVTSETRFIIKMEVKFV